MNILSVDKYQQIPIDPDEEITDSTPKYRISYHFYNISLYILLILIIFCFIKLYTQPVSTEEVAVSFLRSAVSLNPLNDSDGRLTKVLPVSHVFIVSAYYYPTSKSLGTNAVALNMIVDSKNFHVENGNYNVVGSNGTHEELTVATSQIEGVPYCRYTQSMARTNTVENLTKLEMESNGTKVEIPFKMARYKAPKPVIICISPQFVAEQWQIFMMQIHVAHRFGAHLHLYLISILESYFDLMKEYEKQGYLTIDFWLKIKFADPKSPYFEPNVNTELRNQIGAQMDCLLQYKEAAEYIAFFDMDDVLFPKNYPTYLEEFTAEWTLKPNATSVAYGRREHEFIKAETLAEYSFNELIASLKSAKGVKTAKLVVKPELHNTTGLHFSLHEDYRLRNNKTSPHIVHVQRPVQKHGSNEVKKLWKFAFGPLDEKIRKEDIDAIEEDIQRIRNLSSVAEIAERLPKEDFYFPIVFKCYLSQFYRRPVLTECPNAERCFLPQKENLKCIHSDANYISGPSMSPFTYHFTNNSFWSKDIGCYQ
uniref:Glycosyltransferase family 92 protein n=2 Tax=Caenorhabditis tropicalis TaxID=1561998 RepID=A0A1I7V030_9PELO